MALCRVRALSRGHDGSVPHATFSADSRRLITAGSDRTAQVWELESEDVSFSETVLRGHESEIHSIAISPDGNWLATGSEDHVARLWRLNAENTSVLPIVYRTRRSPLQAVYVSGAANHILIRPRNGAAHSTRMQQSIYRYCEGTDGRAIRVHYARFL